MWCLERNIHIVAQHLPGEFNQEADRKSCTWRDQTDWKLNLALFGRVDKLLCPIVINLFASRITKQCPAYYSWRPDPYVVAIDAFLRDWSDKIGFANPSWCLIGRTLSQAQRQHAPLVLYWHQSGRPIHCTHCFWGC